MQEKFTQVERRAAETGISINTKKTKILMSNTKTRAYLTVNWNNQTLVFNEIFLAFQIDPIILNAVLDFPILIFTSLSDPPRLSTSLPR
jgi:hypothetical protein